MGITIREIAEKTGTSKSTAMRAARRLNLLTAENKTGTRGAIELDESQASALAHELTVRKSDPQSNRESNHVDCDSVTYQDDSIRNEANDPSSSEASQISREYIESLRSQIRELRGDKARLIQEREKLQQDIDSLKEENKRLRDRVRTQEELATAAQRERNQMEARLDRMQHATLVERVFGFRKLLPAADTER